MKNELFNPLVSIIIPVFNGENYLTEAIDSALNQTYKNIEIIVVDDGSTDSSAEIITKYKELLRCFHQKNYGVSAALNKGIKEAKGEYISWLSHDDLYRPDKITSQVKIMAGINEDLRLKTIIYSNYSEMNDKYVVYGKSELESRFSLKKLNQPLFSLYKGLVNGCTLLIPRCILLHEGLFDESLRFSQDFDMWQRIFPKYSLVFQSGYTVISRKHDAQGGEKFSPRKLEEYNAIWTRVGETADKELMNLISGSELAFYEEMLRQMRSQKIFKAAHYYEAKINSYYLMNQHKFAMKFGELRYKFLMNFSFYRKYQQLKEELRLTNERCEKLQQKLSNYEK